MTDNDRIEKLRKLIDPRRYADKQFFQDLQDNDKQMREENSHLGTVMAILNLILKGYADKKEDSLKYRADNMEMGYDLESMDKAIEATNKISKVNSNIKNYEPIKENPYFARIDTFDKKGGYNSNYIGEHADDTLHISSWQSPVAEPYFTEDQYSSPINGIDYAFVLLRRLKLIGDKVESFADVGPFTKNLPAEMQGRITAASNKLIYDAYLNDVLKEVLNSRKEKTGIVDIIKTIQKKQYEIIKLPAKAQFVCQGVAGSGKTMVLFHRLSYVLYNNKNIPSAGVLVISPSDSYNDFVKGLAYKLEIDNLQTSTLDSYFMSVLKNAGIDFTGKIDMTLAPGMDYLNYIYSYDFVKELKKQVPETYEGIISFFFSNDNAPLISKLQDSCVKQMEARDKIENSSIRVRNAIMGDILDGKHYSKPFSDMTKCIGDVQEFITLIASDSRMKDSSYFTGRFASFYKSICYLETEASKICSDAFSDLLQLRNAVIGELLALEYGKQGQNTDVSIRNARIIRLNNLMQETDAAHSWIQSISDGLVPIQYFAGLLHKVSNLDDIGKCKNAKDIIAYFYDRFILPKKMLYKTSSKTFIKSDLYAFTLILTVLGYNLTPKYAYLFIDEAQDISGPEYNILKYINNDAVFNIYGDLMQNITEFRGLKNWGSLGFDVYDLDINYRNTNEIVNYVSKTLDIDMEPVGIDGDPVAVLPVIKVKSYLFRKKGLKAIICSDSEIHAFAGDEYNLLRDTNRISAEKINVMTVYESKGLEFSAVAVFDKYLSKNEKYVAYTRALSNLAVVHDTV